MSKILIPIDGSEHSLRALDAVLKRRDYQAGMEIHLLNVQIPVDSGHARMFVSEGELHDYHQTEGLTALADARKKLNDAKVAYSSHVLVGHISETIVTFAKERQLDEIVMGTYGRTGLSHMLLGSIATEVIRMSQLPITLIK